MNHDLIVVILLLEHAPFSLNIHSLVVNDADIGRSCNVKHNNYGEIVEYFFHHDNTFSLVETKKYLSRPNFLFYEVFQLVMNDLIIIKFILPTFSPYQ